MSELPPLNGLVLAGGRSSRMQRDKANIRLSPEQTLGSYAVGLLRSVCAEVFLSLRPDQETPVGCESIPVVRDLGGVEGPLSGVLGAIQRDSSKGWLVLACDMPFLRRSDLAALCAARHTGFPFTCFTSPDSNLPEPLCAIYEPESFPILSSYAEKRDFSPNRIIQHSVHNGISLVECHGRLRSVNTPEELTSSVIYATGSIEAIWTSQGHDFKGRHGLERLRHGATRHASVICHSGMGIVGDRFYGEKPGQKGEITFISAEVTDRITSALNLRDLDPSEFRRNVLTRGIDLAQLIRADFQIGDVRFQGIEECAPCYWMDSAIAPGAFQMLQKHGGIRARILESGSLSCGPCSILTFKPPRAMP